MASLSKKKQKPKKKSKKKQNNKQKKYKLVSTKSKKIISNNLFKTKASKIGNFGKTIQFVVKESKVLTFSSMNRSVSGRWSTHPSINNREKTEFIGPGLSTINMSITLSASFGINPFKTIKTIENAIHKGTVEYLIIGGKKVGSNKYRITGMSESWDDVIQGGKLYKATIDVTFEEYVK